MAGNRRGQAIPTQLGQETLELKVEAFHAEQTKANTQVLTVFTNMSEINVKDPRWCMNNLRIQ